MTHPTTWRPIAEAPRDGTEVDLSVIDSDGIRSRACGVAWENGFWRHVKERWCLWVDVTPTHWIPITQFTKREMGIMSDERDGPTPLKIPGKGRNSVNTNAKILKIFNDARDELGRAMEKCEHLFAGGRKAVGKKEP